MPYSINNSPFLIVSSRSLKIIAALVWYVGSIVLLLKGGSLLMEAAEIKQDKIPLWLAGITGLFLGGLKAKYIFSKSCQRNLDRIAVLARPRIWQFFSPWFFVFLMLMILIGVMLSILAHNNYYLLIVVVILDFSIGIALLGSSYVFFKQ